MSALKEGADVALENEQHGKQNICRKTLQAQPSEEKGTAMQCGVFTPCSNRRDTVICKHATQ
jgi:hypothetical protein